MTKSHCLQFLLVLVLTASAMAQTSTLRKEDAVTNHATGPFDVLVTRQDDKSDDSNLGRFMLDKQYRGELQGTGKGQMLTAGTAVKSSGAYVAIEKFSGTLNGHAGSFVLQHSGIMTQNTPQLTITIVPDSGTDELKGIKGKMTINVAPDGKHSYDLEYTLPKND